MSTERNFKTMTDKQLVAVFKREYPLKKVIFRANDLRLDAETAIDILSNRLLKSEGIIALNQLVTEIKHDVKGGKPFLRETRPVYPPYLKMYYIELSDIVQQISFHVRSDRDRFRRAEILARGLRSLELHLEEYKK